ncbi:winged helix-turn-helix transcriptional regulator [bacterium SCSIO 12696]|nr:winged helix-turn-helix transcriptional regulator [bacterium SCSIO 12696]
MTQKNNIIDYLESLFAILRYEQRDISNAHGLQHVHIQIITYLGRCNRYSDTHQVLCDYLGLTKGTLSTSVGLLVKKGLLEKLSDPADGRKVHLRLTRTGASIYKQLRSSWAKLLQPVESPATVDSSLNGLLRAIQTTNDNHAFGICHSCKHLCRAGKQFSCGLTDEPLQIRETEQICVFHAHPD